MAEPDEKVSEIEGFGKALHQFTGADAAPEYYADALNVNTSVYGTAISFGSRSVGTLNTSSKVHGILRLSPQLTKVLTAILIKQVRTYERDIGKVSIPLEMLKAVSVVEEIKELEGQNTEGRTDGGNRTEVRTVAGMGTYPGQVTVVGTANVYTVSSNATFATPVLPYGKIQSLTSQLLAKFPTEIKEAYQRQAGDTMEVFLVAEMTPERELEFYRQEQLLGEQLPFLNVLSIELQNRSNYQNPRPFVPPLGSSPLQLKAPF